MVQSPELNAWMWKHMRHLHARPELAWHEFETSAYVREQLEGLGIRFEWPVARIGVVGIIGSGEAPCVALRADMDALPIQEESGVEYRSLYPGKMHACGHDVHVSILLGAARIVQSRRHLLPGTVRLLFQPAEEGSAGAQAMLEEGALGNSQAIFALHVSPFADTGTVLLKPGPVMAGSGLFEAVITGQGGHAALPHTTVDPVLAAAMAIAALQQLVAREADPLDSQVVSVTMVQGGKAYNVGPDSVKLGGTFRAFSRDSFRRLKERIEEVIVSQAAVHRCQARLSFLEEGHPFYPPVINDEALYEHARRMAEGLVGPERVLAAHPVMAAEDFAFYLQKVPGLFAILSMRNSTFGSTHSGHTSKYVVDPSALPHGVVLMAALAETYLRERTISVQTEFR